MSMEWVHEFGEGALKFRATIDLDGWRVESVSKPELPVLASGKSNILDLEAAIMEIDAFVTGDLASLLVEASNRSVLQIGTVDAMRLSRKDERFK
jgi:hypothetical protein